MTLLRSLLFVPGVRPDRFAKAEAAGADAVVFDLEDSVEAGRKDEARRAISEHFASRPRTSATRIVRVNGVRTPFFDDDLAFVRSAGEFDAVMLPKAESASAIERAASAAPQRTVIPLLETARAVLDALAILSADAAIPAVVFGGEDLTAQLGIARTIDGEELLFARSHVVLAAAAINADAIDGIVATIGDEDVLRADGRRARALGYRGKLAIHPTQVPVINAVFGPSPEEVAEAERIVQAYEAAAARGEGVLRLGDQMIDMPVVARARRVLQLARRSG
jgi:citrate lyase subunit beta/citryl-CoA lyase